MATFTAFLGLRKPATSDNVNVELDLSDNFELIDAKLEEIETFLNLAGFLFPYGGDVAPSGFFLADGSAVSRSSFPLTFGVCGTKFGVGNGTTTFNLPNVKGNVLVGVDGSQTEFDIVGKTGGAKSVALTVAQLPNHTHDLHGWNGGHSIGQNTVLLDGHAPSWEVKNGIPGEETMVGQAHNNLQPYLALNWIMRAV